MTNDPLPLSVDPIGDFLRAKGAAGDAPVAENDERTRLERFRREFPGLPLPELGSPELAEHLTALRDQGFPPAEVEATRRICQEFLDFKNQQAQGVLSPRVETRREMPYTVSRAAVHAPPQAQSYQPRASGGSKVVWVLLVAAVAAGAYAWKHYQANAAKAESPAGDVP